MGFKPAMLVSWGVRAVYIGPGFQLPAHRNAVAVLALALKVPMRVAIDAHDPAKGFRSCYSVLIEPNQWHLIETSKEDDHAFIYIDALSNDLVTLRARCLQPGEALSFDLKDEHEVIHLLARMQHDEHSWTSTQEVLATRLGFISCQNESRIAPIVKALLLHPNDQRCAEDWAKQVGLSSSRFQHIFKENTGISFRRFRLWARMRFALAHVMRGSSLTHAAMEAGLSSSAHLSTAFKAMFGITPSQLIGVAPLYVET